MQGAQTDSRPRMKCGRFAARSSGCGWARYHKKGGSLLRHRVAMRYSFIQAGEGHGIRLRCCAG